MEFHVLGPMAVSVRGIPVQLGGMIQRGTLGMLAFDANNVVAASQLLRMLWPSGAPVTGRKMLQNAVSSIRRIIATCEPSGGPELLTCAPGYLLRVESENVDLVRFRWLADKGRKELANGAWSAAAMVLRDALALWRGDALADLVENGIAVPEIRLAQNRRLSAYEDCFDAELACGRHYEAVGELEAMVRVEPFRERLRGQSMIALYRCGRQVDALNTYRNLHTALADSQGIEPSPQVRELHQMILRHDVRLTTSATPMRSIQSELYDRTARQLSGTRRA